MRYPLVILLALMVIGVPAFGGSGDTPSDPVMLEPSGNFEFSFDEFSSTPPDDITYYVWLVYGPSDSTSIATIPNVTVLDPSLVYTVVGEGPTAVQGDPGELVRIVVWGPDAADGQTDSCEKWAMKKGHAACGCALVSR